MYLSSLKVTLSWNSTLCSRVKASKILYSITNILYVRIFHHKLIDASGASLKNDCDIFNKKRKKNIKHISSIYSTEYISHLPTFSHSEYV